MLLYLTEIKIVNELEMVSKEQSLYKTNHINK